MVPRPLLLACISLVFSACTPTEPSSTDVLDFNRARWEAHRPAMYEFVFQRMCECLPAETTPKRVTVQQGYIVSVADLQTGEPIISGRHAALSIEELFEEIESALNRGVDRVSVRYHPTLGYPMSIHINNHAKVIDEIATFTARDVRALLTVQAGRI